MTSVQLAEQFLAYCKQYPEQRFWQALYNWLGVAEIEVDGRDPFYWRGLMSQC